MSISVVFVVKNAVKQGYCFWESLHSALPFADEVVISEGFSDDDTLKYIRAFLERHPDIPISVYQDKWEEKSYHGEVIAKVSQRAINQARGDWVYYLQADEIIHEDMVGHIKKIAASPDYNSASFPFYHFIREWKPCEDPAYKEAIRMIRRNKKIVLQGDAWNFYGETEPMCPASECPKPIYHFGWVFSKENVIKDIEHAKIYENVTHYQEMMKKACSTINEEKEAYPLTDFDDFPEISKRFLGLPSYPLPEVL